MPGMSVVLRPVSAAAAERILAGEPPPGVAVAPGYPTEFSTGIAQAAARASSLGPFFIHRAEDDVVVGEIGGGFVGAGVVEIGYAIVRSAWGRGYATDAVRALLDLARDVDGIERIVGHTPLDRPASGRVLEKAGFVAVGEVEDEHEGQVLRVVRWQRDVAQR